MEFHAAIEPPQQPSAIAWSFVFAQGELLLPLEQDQLAPGQLVGASEVRHYLGRLGGHDAWALRTNEVPEGWRRVPLRTAMMGMPPEQMGLAARAAQLIEWERAHQFCGVCGTPTEHVSAERARRCPSCGHLAYPRITPAMMTLIWRSGEVLLARGPNFRPGVYSALAGFVEAGETLEQCVVRETAEEVGVSIGDLKYFGSQSWPFPHSLMVAFTARWTGGEIVPQPGEIEDAQWFSIDALPILPPLFSISGHLIRDTVQALAEGREP